VADVHGRLVRCFSSVFPVLTEEQIQGADVASLAYFDSLTAVTLVAVINEDFGVEMDQDILLKLGTFQAVQHHLREQIISSVFLDEQSAK
jgi:acyl carrier protein